MATSTVALRGESEPQIQVTPASIQFGSQAAATSELSGNAVAIQGTGASRLHPRPRGPARRVPRARCTDEHQGLPYPTSASWRDGASEQSRIRPDGPR